MPKRKSEALDGEDKLIIGLDFGTTFSGVSYCFIGAGITKAEPVLITEWPGARGRRLQKVPTRIQYRNGEDRNFLWGYEVDQYARDKIECFKLLLDPDATRPIWTPATDHERELQRLGKPLLTVVADYLGAVHKHAMVKIESQWPADYIALYEKHFVLTVPAIWSDKAKDITLQAARKAGLNQVELVKEPEAAALCTFRDLKIKSLKAGDAFVLCDAGGGTVDLISYEVTCPQPLKLKELVAGSGGFSGSMMLNKRFEDVIEMAVGSEQFCKLRITEGYAYAMKQFDESIKTGFNPIKDCNTDHKYLVPFPGAGLKDDPDNSINQNCFTLTTETLVKIFKPLIENIELLVKDQVSTLMRKRVEGGASNAFEVKAIFLAGGFGSSSYLHDRLQQLYTEIQILQPHDAWSAIARGAVLRQLPWEALIESTTAVQHYGVSALSPFLPVDEGQPKHWDRFSGQYMVAEMTWYILRNDRLKRGRKIRFPFHHDFEKDYNPAGLIFTVDLVQSQAIRPVKYPSKGVTSTNCQLKADLRSISPSLLKFVTSEKGADHYQLDYDLIITTEAANFKFSVEDEGTEIASVEADYFQGMS